MQCFKVLKNEIKNRLDVNFYIPEFQEIDNIINNSEIKYESLENITLKITDGAHQSPSSSPLYSYKYVTVKDINDYGEIDLEHCNRIDKDDYIAMIKTGCKPAVNDILFSKDGTVGKVYRVKENDDFVILSSLAILRPDTSKILPEYLEFILRNSFTLTIIKRLMSGAAIQRIILDNLKQILIPVPSLKIQREYAQKLQQIYQNKLKKEQEAKVLLESTTKTSLELLDIKNIDERSKKTFSVSSIDVEKKRLDVYGYQPVPRAIINGIKQSKFKETIVPLKTLIAENFSGDWGTDIEQYTDETYTICNVIRNKNFSNLYNIDYEDVAQRKILNTKKEKILLKKGDILIEKSGGSPQQPVGRVAYIENDIENYTFSNFLQCIRINTKLCEPEYLFIYLRTIYKLNYMKYIQSQTIGIINLLMDDFLNIPVILLKDKDAQKEIIDKYNQVQINAKQLQEEAKNEFEEAKAEVEKMILGEK